MSEREGAHTSEREIRCQISSLCFPVLLLLLVLILSLREVVGFSPLWFPREKFFVSLVFVIIVVHVILLYKILDHIP